MIDSRNDSANKSGLPPGGETSSIEQTIGAIVVQMIREGQKVSRQSLCLAIASRIENSTSPELEAHYADILRLILTRQSS